MRDIGSFNERVSEVLALAFLRTIDRRDGDVFVCSYPKCGRTWLRFMITRYQLRLRGLDADLTLKNLWRFSPNLKLTGRYGLFASRVPEPLVRVFGTHSRHPGLFRQRRVIHLSRDLRDVLVSYFHHQRARQAYDGLLTGFVWEYGALAELIAYVDRWQRWLAAQPPSTALCLRYEDLQTDSAGGLRAAITHMGLPVDEDLLREAAEFGSADNMRRLEKSHGTLEFSTQDLAQNAEAFHVRRATVSGFRDELSEPDIRRINAEIVRRLGRHNGYSYE